MTRPLTREEADCIAKNEMLKADNPDYAIVKIDRDVFKSLRFLMEKDETDLSEVIASCIDHRFDCDGWTVDALKEWFETNHPEDSA